MPEYRNMDRGIAGLQQGLNNEIEGRFVAAEEIEFGLPVFGYVDNDEQVGVYHLDVAKLVYDADFVTGNLIDGTVNGVSITQVPFNATQLATITDVVAAFDALTGVDAILDTSDVTNRTVLIRTKFADALVTSVVTGGASQAGTTVTYTSGQVFFGCSLFTQKSAINADNRGVYEQYESVNVLTRGMINVKPIAAVKAYEAAFVDNAGADKGSWSNAGFEIPGRYTESVAADTITTLEVTGKKNEADAESFV